MAICIGEAKLDTIVANLTEFKLDEDLPFRKDGKFKVHRMYLHLVLR